MGKLGSAHADIIYDLCVLGISDLLNHLQCWCTTFSDELISSHPFRTFPSLDNMTGGKKKPSQGIVWPSQTRKSALNNGHHLWLSSIRQFSLIWGRGGDPPVVPVSKSKVYNQGGKKQWVSVAPCGLLCSRLVTVNRLTNFILPVSSFCRRTSAGWTCIAFIPAFIKLL